MFRTRSCSLAALAAVVLVSPPARAQLAVIDGPATAQLIHEVQAMEQQVRTAQNQLTQAQRSLATMTGDRGMERLLAGVTRNYLPSSWAQLIGAMNGAGGAFPGLSTDVRNAVSSNAVLTPQQMAALSPADQQQILARRQASALRQGLAQESLANASGRFGSLQSLIAAIAAAGDQKGILDLQARIGAELGMLQNEQTKLHILEQASQAQAAVAAQQEREQVIAGHGNFAGRFQPAP
jgi:type IV secretion system protein VirB5